MNFIYKMDIFRNCNKLFIDFDGVIVDSNNFKELAIKRDEVWDDRIASTDNPDWATETNFILKCLKFHYDVVDMKLKICSNDGSCLSFFI